MCFYILFHNNSLPYNRGTGHHILCLHKSVKNFLDNIKYNCSMPYMRAICCILSAIIICFNLFATPSWESPALHNGQLRLDGQLYKRMGLGMLSLARIQVPDIFGAQHFKIPVRRTRIFLPMDGSATDVVCRADERRNILAFPGRRGIFLQMEQQKLSDARIQTDAHKNSVYSI